MYLPTEPMTLIHRVGPNHPIFVSRSTGRSKEVLPRIPFWHDVLESDAKRDRNGSLNSKVDIQRLKRQLGCASSDSSMIRMLCKWEHCSGVEACSSMLHPAGTRVALGGGLASNTGKPHSAPRAPGGTGEVPPQEATGMLRKVAPQIESLAKIYGIWLKKTTSTGFSGVSGGSQAAQTPSHKGLYATWSRRATPTCI